MKSFLKTFLLFPTPKSTARAETEETSLCPTPLVRDASSSRGFVLPSLEEHASEAQGKLVLLPNLSTSGASIRDSIAHPNFFSVPLSCTGYILVHVSLVGKGTPGSQRRRSGTRTHIISFYLVLSTLLSAYREDSHWAKPPFLLKLSSAFPLLQTCSCLMLHRKDLGLGRIVCCENHSIRPIEGFFLVATRKPSITSNQYFCGLFLFFGRREVKILLLLSHIPGVETQWVLYYPFGSKSLPKIRDDLCLSRHQSQCPREFLHV